MADHGEAIQESTSSHLGSYADAGDSDPMDDWDHDSTMGDSIQESTASMTSSIARYEHEHGRRYHAYQAGKYYMPNDEEEQDLMDLAHYIGLAVHEGSLFLAPSKEPTSILDLGTGTGSWAVDVADHFPNATVIGTDLSPIQPSWVPPNLQFEVSDCEDEWTYHTPFDLIHMRNLTGSIQDWPKLLHQVQNHLTSDGWVDIASIDFWVESNNNALPADSALAQWRHLLHEAIQLSGRTPRAAQHVHDRVLTAGFTNITQEVFKLPLSPWIRTKQWIHIAELMRYLMDRELDGLSLALFTRVLKWSAEDVRELLTRVRVDMANMDYELYCVVYYVYAQKPHGNPTEMVLS